jgi:hypothetical protein
LLDRFIFRQYQINTISEEGNFVGTSSIFGSSPTYSAEEINYHLGEPEEGPAEADLLPANVLGWVPIIEEEDPFTISTTASLIPGADQPPPIVITLQPRYQIFPFETEPTVFF